MALGVSAIGKICNTPMSSVDNIQIKLKFYLTFSTSVI